jgi:hypothetical protein
LVEFCVEVDGPQEILELTDLNNTDCFRMNVTSAPPRVVGVIRNDGEDNLDRLTSLTFEFDVDVSGSLDIRDLGIIDQATGAAIDLSSLLARDLVWDPIAMTARWNLNTLTIPSARYEVALDASSIFDASGTMLDGNGDGIPGDNFVQELLVALPGDASLDGCVDGSDFNLWNSHKFQSGGVSWQEGDFNNDDSVDGSDFNLWNANKFTCLPSPRPQKPLPFVTMPFLPDDEEEHYESVADLVFGQVASIEY